MGSFCCKEEPVDLMSEVELSHFALLRSVGKGAFGKVRVVQHKGTKKLYALKYINKDKCLEMNATKNIISERNLLENINYGLIVNLRYAFQDDENLFMVLDLMLGGDLRFHLDRMGKLPERFVRFYAAEISLSLNYLHKQHIIHRDLKPENILLDEKGHVHLSDLNIAVQLTSKKKSLTTIAGSLAYISPEILKKQGYSYSTDWWSLGVVIYELLYGKRPFKARTNEELQNLIMYGPIHYPNEPTVSPEAIDFMQSLLSRDISKRIGIGEAGFKQLKDHAWLKDACWDILSTKTVGAPFVPDEKKSNFDPTHELEEVFLEDNPLKVRRRTVKKSVSCEDMSALISTNEKHLLEQAFLNYDFTKPEEKDTSAMIIHSLKEQTSFTDETCPILPSPEYKNLNKPSNVVFSL